MFSALEVFYENALYKFTFNIDIDIDINAKAILTNGWLLQAQIELSGCEVCPLLR